VALNTLGQPLAAERVFREAIRISSADQNEQAVSPMLLNNLSRTLHHLHRLPEAADYAERAYTNTRRLGDEIVVHQSLSGRATIYRLRGDLDRAAEMLAELEPRIKRMFAPGHMFFATFASHQSLLLQARGDLHGALPAADRAVALAEATPQGLDYLPSYLLRRSDIELQIRRLEDARSDAGRALRMEQEAGEPGAFSCALGRAYLALGRALHAQGTVDEARVAFASALEHLQPTLGADHPETRDARRLVAQARTD